MYTFYAQHRTAIESSVEVIRRVRSDMLTLPTPCAGWTLADLLTHMTAQHHGFAAAACGDGREQAVWHAESYAVEVTADPVGSYASAADEVLRAFATDGVEDTLFALPELGPEITVPGAVALGFHFVDYVVHGWDVATTLGRPYRLPADVITAALPIAMAVPDGEIRDDAAFPFARSVEPTGTGADVHDDFAQLLRHLGRDVDGVAATSIVNSGTGHRREG
ncbi:TIGR03086 family metal-binding protein [uncultured Mycolicibacterium sp.]|uniref:TIGR03086 family metal-binding protein n=1 Tax=uncultured Mycolicibacterium sp. TaxID=2320817 RepID=UPI0032B1AEBB